MQFRYLLEQGLQPHHTLLDFGCGSLGAGVFFIEYLQEGKYTGVDISSGIISVANYVMREKHLEFKHPSVSVIADMTCTGMGNKKFDYIFAYSVLSHMPKEDVDELFMNIRKIMTETTLFYASYFESSEKYYTSVSRRNFHYPYLLLKELADKHHLRLERMPGTTDNGKQNFLKITMLQ
jgi:cyclopropane fatty-acyl-phospholipid synthase-like methyltransferase